MARHFGPVQELALVEIVPAAGVAVDVIPAGQEAYRYTELMIRLPADWPTDDRLLADPNASWPVSWLRRIAAYPAENDTWLGGPYTIVANEEPPEPLAPNTGLTCLLLLQEQGEAGVVRARDGRQILLYSLVPLYTEKRDLELQQGVGALFAGFDAHGLSEVVDPRRVNTAA